MNSSNATDGGINALIVELDALSEGGNGWNPAYHPKAANEQEREFRDRLAIEWPRIRSALLGPLPTLVSETRQSDWTEADAAELRYWRSCNADIMHRKDLTDGMSHHERVSVLRHRASQSGNEESNHG